MKKLGRYEIIEKIGEGGMGTVYKAKQPTLNKIVALKVLADFCAKDEKLVERFMREARIMANLPDYRHVVQVFDLDEADGKYFYAMEYIPLSLAEYIGDFDIDTDQTRKVRRKSKVIPVEMAMFITRHILKGLKVIHNAGVIHRDISPQNVLLIRDNEEITAKITDFGIAGIRDSGLTKTGTSGIGKEIYAAPEQLESLASANEQSDIYSLGILMYRMVTGRLPVGVRPKQPFELNPDVGDSLNDMISKATEQEPKDRFQRAEKMLEELERITGAVGDVSDEGKTSPISARKPVQREKLKYKLRRAPIVVSKGKYLEAFGLNDACWPQEYIKNDFEENGDGTVTDHATGLMWQQCESARMEYQQAHSYIRDLNRQCFAGYSDWRLPTVNELMSLLEPKKQSNDLYLDPLFGKQQFQCWSADIRPRGLAWVTCFNTGLVKSSGSTILKYFHVQAVRSCESRLENNRGVTRMRFPVYGKKNMQKTKTEEAAQRVEPQIFKHHKTLSDNWDLGACKQVDIWLRQQINRLPIGKPIKVKKIAISSRKIAHIMPRGNADGVRYLLWQLHCEGYIGFKDNLHFFVCKKTG